MDKHALALASSASSLWSRSLFVCTHLHVLQVLHISRGVAVPLTVLNDLKPPSTNRVHHRSAVWEEFDIADLQQTPVAGEPAGKSEEVLHFKGELIYSL